MSAGISLHVVDVASGCVAQGLDVRLVRLEGAQQELICQGRIASNGVLVELEREAGRCTPGV
ncbi:hypothetical protein D3C77_551400 [compost metagenome]